ncbi:MAG: metallophosphoesterase [Deltaproteobacteria bacterium]|nr:metallophosphoesterase [Deltaproteobacteria bacterium]
MRGGKAPTSLAHITDAHVAPGGRRTAVLKDLSVPILEDLTDQLIALGADAALFGGDNIDNQGEGERDLEAFVRIADRFDRWVAITGNHESVNVQRGEGRISKEQFAAGVAGHGIEPGRYNFSQVIGDVRVIGIDTTLSGSEGGYVAPRTMDFLARELRSAGEEHVVVLGHHLLAAPWAPYRLDVWDRQYLVANRDVVISLLSTCPRVRAYLCGHHHASRIHRIAGRGDSAGFYHILTPSPAAYPLAARLITFEQNAMIVRSVRPRIPGAVDIALGAVLGGRKAKRFETLGNARGFSDYVAGRASDNDAILPYDRAIITLRPDGGEDRRVADAG